MSSKSINLKALKAAPAFRELSSLGRQASFQTTLDLFTNHPEVFAVLWAFNINAYYPRSASEYSLRDVSTDLIDDNVNNTGMLSVMGVVIDTKLANGLAIPSYSIELDGRKMAVVGFSGIVDKLPTIAFDLRELFFSLLSFKAALNAAWGSEVITVVHRDGDKLCIKLIRDFFKSIT